MKAAAGAKVPDVHVGFSDRIASKVLLIGSSQCMPEATGTNFNAQLDDKTGFDVIVSCHSGAWIAQSTARTQDAFMVVEKECQTHQPSLVVLFHGANDVYWNKEGGNGGSEGSLELLKQEPRLFVNATRTACGADTKIILAQGVVHTKSDAAFNTLRSAMQQTAGTTAGVTFADMGSWADIHARKDQYCKSTTALALGKVEGELCEGMHFCKFHPNQNCALLREITTKLANSIKTVLGLS